MSSPASCQWQAEAAGPAKDISMAVTLLMKTTHVWHFCFAQRIFFPVIYYRIPGHFIRENALYHCSNKSSYFGSVLKLTI